MHPVKYTGETQLAKGKRAGAGFSSVVNKVIRVISQAQKLQKAQKTQKA